MYTSYLTTKPKSNPLPAKCYYRNTGIFLYRAFLHWLASTQDGGGVTVKHSGWVDCPLLIASFRQWLHNGELLIEELFNYGSLQIQSGFFQYNGMQFRNIVFCEGYRAAANPFFNDTLIPCKGDIISIAARDTCTRGIIKKNAFYMLPAEEGIKKGWCHV